MSLSDWAALVLTAGLATRLRPLSDVRAKAAMPVAGRSIIVRILEWLRAAGVRRVVLNLHHRPETITRIVGDGSEWDLQVKYSWEMPVLGSAGGPRRALPILEAERFLLVNGDTLTDCDLQAVARQHLETGALVTMAVVPGDVQRYGGVLVDEKDVVHGFGRGSTLPATPVMTALHFIGVQAVNADAFAGVPENQPSETVKTLYPALIASRPGAIRAYRSDAEFLDVGTPADYLATAVAMAARENQPLDRGVGCRIDPGARVERTVMWDRVVIPADAQLIDCVLADDVTVPAGAHCVRTAIVNGREGIVFKSF